MKTHIFAIYSDFLGFVLRMMVLFEVMTVLVWLKLNVVHKLLFLNNQLSWCRKGLENAVLGGV